LRFAPTGASVDPSVRCRLLHAALGLILVVTTRFLCACSSNTPSGLASDEPFDAGGSDSASPGEAAADDAGAAASDGTIDRRDAFPDDATLADVLHECAARHDAVDAVDASAADAGIAGAVDSDAATESGPREASSNGAPTDAPSDSAIDATIDATVDAAQSADAAAATAAADAEASAVVPILDGGLYVFTSGALSFEVDPHVGGRIVSFALDGQNVLSGPDANPTNYGSTFWTSPQSDWSWPPPPEIDNLPYAATVDGGTLTLRGTENAALGVSITKAFSVDAVRGSVSIAYTIENAGTSARPFAPWEVTRVRPTGLVFFPTGVRAFSADSGPAFETQEAAGATWFDVDTTAIDADAKFFADAARGWIAQAAAGVVFVKKFAGASPGSEAPGEAEIEMFVSGDHAYVEIEGQGPYRSIAAGGSVTWSVTWVLARTPAGVDASVGSAALVAFVEGL
jgi:Domain of unknown function (DUF4380)